MKQLKTLERTFRFTSGAIVNVMADAGLGLMPRCKSKNIETCQRHDLKTKRSVQILYGFDSRLEPNALDIE